MKPIASFPAETACRIVCVLTDIDDTLTTDGQLPAASYSALERLRGAGLAVVPVTGRPAGWCDMIARFWPVDGVIGENGAFYFRHDPVARKMVRKFIASEAERAVNRQKLLALGQLILAEVPGAAISADQLYREADLAIDFCEDVAPLPRSAVDKIVCLFESAGGIAKVSSIHVNGWFGRYDKLVMTRIFLHERLGLDLDEARDRIVFCGDSPNDAPMFGFFPYACGVANVRDFEGAMAATPAFIASKRGAEGFVEIAERILAARAGA
ncbi:HAD-IIB family hydrolase [Bradyrhizobium genosp. L]|uniref:HAD-IIB family hydrolase n=1 Tax=Bradyrhizobium genosp. L TaxID=83637 RepID=UPI0018A2DA7D|nr:HAD-IIB family hydrolase [Bradyrhizobium genosp. L]QPF86814.1 HAD-IIB family hydrolase [Bradyrhizobium genosp. L]